MVNWSAKESFTKLLAAIYAAHPGVKFNFSEIAHFFGDGATYDAIEGRFRIIKKEAADLRKKAGEPGPSSARRRKSISRQPVLTGRVTKRSGRGRKPIKRETVESDDEAGGSTLAEEQQEGNAGTQIEYEDTQVEYEDDEES
ncbi:MAG: hypothetical protein M1840_000020 [Geoglossum simile]|nr:MAG: hypothetical protein M1840_000020 [Geoglossum simile]